MYKKCIAEIWILLLLAAGGACAQSHDTIRMMQYNLMFYTNSSGVSDCNSVTNNLDAKDTHIKTIFQYVMPDVLCVCELGSNNQYADRLLNNAINTNGINYYKRGPLTNYSGGNIANMIYYNSRKLTFYKAQTITTAYRDINGYKFYYNADNLSSGDTIFMTYWIAHLKAGSYSNDENARLIQVQRLMNKLTQLGEPGNHLFSGDFNIYHSNEAAYKELTEYSNSLYRFYDPISCPGNWHNNSQYASLHTQSTHSQSDDCFSAGGLDDRFDIILVSPSIFYGTNNMHIVEGSYHALGQDGMRFNGSIVSPTNNSIPSQIANALYQQSDHLPVIMDMTIDARVGVSDYQPNLHVNVANPIRDHLQIDMQNEDGGHYDISIFTMDGRCIARHFEDMDAGLHRLTYPFPFPKGVYLVVLRNENGLKITRKVICH